MLSSRLAILGTFALSLSLTAADKPTVVKLDKLSAAAPADWISEKPANRLRSFQFKLPASDPAFAAAEVIVMPESNPNPDKSFPRWKESFVPPEGKTADDISKVSKFDISSAKVTLLDVTGTWKYKERPFDPKSKEELRPDYRVVWVIVVEGDEATHLRISGPASVLEKRYPEFEKWLKSMK